jgi:class 3 adenylate cyclase
MEPAPELVPYMERIVRKTFAGDAGAFVDVIAHEPGAILIGTDDEEWYEGYETITALLRVQMPEIQALRGTDQINLIFEEVTAWKEGSVGWTSSYIREDLLGEENPPMRLTCVFHEEGAQWRVVQWHASFPLSNVAVLGHSLTTSVDEILALVGDYASPTSAMAADGTVTIMFTDIVGSTALMESLGEQRWLELLDWHTALVTKQAADFGGTVIKGQGDGFMLAFPAIGSAAACAIGLQRASSEGSIDVKFQLRIGIHCGNAKSEGGDFFGRTVVVAARLLSAAGSGEILVSELLRKNLGVGFSMGEPKSLTLKGLNGEYTAYPLLWQ